MVVLLLCRLCFEVFKSPVFLQMFCICPMFFMLEWFLMVSILLFKSSFAGSVVYFSMIVSKIWCNFCFVYNVCNLVLVGKRPIRFIHAITVYCLCFNTGETNPNVDVRTLLCYFIVNYLPLYFKFTVISWVNDC